MNSVALDHSGSVQFNNNSPKPAKHQDCAQRRVTQHVPTLQELSLRSDKYGGGWVGGHLWSREEVGIVVLGLQGWHHHQTGSSSPWQPVCTSLTNMAVPLLCRTQPLLHEIRKLSDWVVKVVESQRQGLMRKTHIRERNRSGRMGRQAGESQKSRGRCWAATKNVCASWSLYIPCINTWIPFGELLRVWERNLPCFRKTSCLARKEVNMGAVELVGSLLELFWQELKMIWAYTVLAQEQEEVDTQFTVSEAWRMARATHSKKGALRLFWRLRV